MPLVIPNIESSPTFDAQSLLDATDLAAELALGQETGVISGCGVSQHTGTDMKVVVAAGSVSVQATVLAVAAASVTIGAASASDRKDIIVVNNSASVYAVAGAPSGVAGWTRNSPPFVAPIKPNIPANSVLLGEVYVASTTTGIATGNIIDKTAMIQLASFALTPGIGIAIGEGSGGDVVATTGVLQADNNLSDLTSVGTALTNLGLNLANFLMNPEPVNVVAAAGATQTAKLGANKYTLSANLTVNMPAPPFIGTLCTIECVQAVSGGGGPFSVTIPNVVWPGGTAPTMSTAPDAKDRYDAWWDGTAWLGRIVAQNYPAPTPGIVQQITAVAVNSTHVTATLASVPSPSNILVLAYGGEYGTDIVISPLSWTELSKDETNTNVVLAWVPSDGETTTFTVTPNNIGHTGDAKCIWIAEVAGLTGATDSAVTTNGHDSNASPDTVAPGTSTVAHQLQIVAFAPTNDVASGSMTGGFTAQAEIGGAGSTFSVGLVVGTKFVTSVGAISTAITWSPDTAPSNGWASAGLVTL